MAERPVPRMLMGNLAVGEGALAAGCCFYAGYPITPSSEIMEFLAEKLPKCGGAFIQMEDEIASICAVIGASWSGAKAMTATSGPGFSLMMEGLGYAALTETPCVIVDVQRAGPATGQATRVGAGDVLQARYGSHGDICPVAYSPWSVQEMYDLTIQSFNTAERFRVPVLLMADEAVGHLRESVVLHRDFPIVQRNRSQEKPPFGTLEPNGVPPMPAFGEGAALMVTGSTHDEFGFRQADDPEVHARLVERINRKILDRAAELVRVEQHFLEDAELALVAYGITARSALAAVKACRQEGLKVGLLRLITLWPFAEDELAQLSTRVGHLLVPEMNRGQLAGVVRQHVRCPVSSLSQTNGDVIEPEVLVAAVRRVLR